MPPTERITSDMPPPTRPAWFTRPTQRLTSDGAGLIVVDLQDKLLALIAERERVVAWTLGLIRGAGILGIPVWTTEQYPKGLGPTTEAVAACVGERHAKASFHCYAVPRVVEELAERKIRHVTLVGIEAHVCIAQTALELMDRGFQVQIPADAVGARRPYDKDVALGRLAHAGAVVSTAEAVLFEWTERADRPEFKAISALVKEFDRDLARPDSQ